LGGAPSFAVLERILMLEFADNSCPADSAVADNHDAGFPF
jgi:hypothetical protein